MKLAATFLLALVTLCLTMRADELGLLLDRLQASPIDEGALFALEKQPDDGRIIPALRTAFEQAKTRNEKQWVASTLLRLGDTSPRFFDFLVDSAKEAIDDRTPLFFDYDRQGQAIKGRFSATFEAWCTANGKDPRAVAALQFETYPEDVLMLARSHDPRAKEVLRRALQSPNPMVAGYAVQGLGRLQDTEALPLIAKLAEELPAAKAVICMNLPWFVDAAAMRLLERLVPDSKARAFLVRSVEIDRLSEQQNAIRRRQKPAPKQ